MQAIDPNKPVRYAVVGLGYISQAAVLPAFAHAESNSQLTALVSQDPEKLAQLGKAYGVSHLYSYDQYEQCLRSGLIDAVYIALPNNFHCEYTLAAAEAGIHVLCEKPMAMTEDECRTMIEASERHSVKLMIAYRLHFETANLEAVEIVKSGKIGTPRFLLASFSQQVKSGDIRVTPELGGGSVYDMGVYCINAARYLFQAEPSEVEAFSANNGEARFQGVDEMTSAILRFPDQRLASFISSMGSADTSYCRIVGTQGDIVLEPAYDFSIGLQYRVTIEGKTYSRKLPRRDHFASELVYFSDCLRKNKQPEPSGWEGLADVRIIQAISRSVVSHQAVPLPPFQRKQRPAKDQEIKRPPVRRMPELIHASPPSGN